MTDTVQHPHDGLFREIMHRKAEMISELRAVLPASMVRDIDWDTVELLSAAFVDKLRGTSADIVLGARISGTDGYLHLLVEHQSKPDWTMPLRISEYRNLLCRRHLAENPKERLLPPVIPLVVYTGHDGIPWTAPVDYLDLINLPEGKRTEWAPHLTTRYVLDDITKESEGALRARGLTPAALATLLLEKITAQSTDPIDAGRGVADVLRLVAASPTAVSDLEAFLRYIIVVMGARGRTVLMAEWEAFIDELGPEAKEAYMTIADILQARGEARGELNGRMDMLLQVIATRFPEGVDSVVDTVRSGTAEQLRLWGSRVAVAETIDEIFA